MADKLENLISRLEQVASRLEKVKIGGSAASTTSSDADEIPEQVTAYDAYYNDSLKPFLEQSKKLGKELTATADFFQRAFDETRKLVLIASKSKKPSDSELSNYIKPLAKIINDMDDYRAKNRGDFYDHLYGSSEAIKSFSWVVVPNTTISHVKDSIPQVQFYTNKVLVKYRKTDATHTEWVNLSKKILEDLAAYIKEHHMTGLRWNASGKDFAQAASTVGSVPTAVKAAPANTGSAPPPPPPPTNAPPPPVVQPSAPQPEGGMDAVFDQIRAGNVTGGLKKVTKDMKTKNMANRTGLVTAVEKKTTTTSSKKAQEKTGPPKFELVEDKKWVVENQVGNKEIVIDKTEFRHTVYILRCVDCIIQIKGKVNAITLDSCKKTGLVFESTVASCELVNCQTMQVQVLGTVPTMAVDKTDGAQLILSKESMNTVIVTSKSSEMNVCIPKDDDDIEEIPIPEQYETKWDEKKKTFVTVCTSHV